MGNFDYLNKQDYYSSFASDIEQEVKNP